MEQELMDQDRWAANQDSIQFVPKRKPKTDDKEPEMTPIKGIQPSVQFLDLEPIFRLGTHLLKKRPRLLHEESYKATVSVYCNNGNNSFT